LGYYLLGKTYSGKSIFNIENTKNYQNALNAFNRAIELNLKPTVDANVFYERGFVYSQLEKYKEAIADLNKALEIDPKISSAFSFRGQAHFELGNYQQAINDYNKAIELKPQYANAKAYYNRGVAYGKLGNYQQAINDYNKAIQLNPKDAKAYFNRGVAYDDLGNKQKFIADMKIAAKLGNKKAQDLLRSEGIETGYYPSQGKQQEETAKKGLSCRDDIDACERIGLDYYKTGEYDKAVEIFSEMIGLRPFTTSYFVHRGNCYLQKSDNASAISDFKYAAGKGDKGAQEFLKSKGIKW
jgi:tetratricopeptide (TPR) repeat protein